MQLKIQRWRPDSLKSHRIIMVVGRRGSGKSTLIEDILCNIKSNFDFAIAMSPTEESLGMFRRHIPEACIYEGYNAAKIEEIVNMQKQLCLDGRHRSVLICLDDCMYDRTIMRSKVMREIHFNGRHLKLTLITAVQYLVDIPCELRTQVDYVISLKENILTNKQKLHKYYFGVFESFDSFCRTLEKVTENFGAIVLDNTSATNELQKLIHWYRASIQLPPFKVGSELFWRLSAKYQLSDRKMRENKTRLYESSLSASSSSFSSKRSPSSKGKQGERGSGGKEQIILC